MYMPSEPSCLRRRVYPFGFATCVMVLATLWAIDSVSIGAQSRESPVDEPTTFDVLPDATFGARFRKYTPPQNVFSPFYSWDADMSLDLTLVRRGPGAVRLSSMFQTAGTKNLGSKIAVGGTGYFLGVGYVHTRSTAIELSSGLIHFSSHLTRDLDATIDEERRKGAAIPLADDPSEFNVIYLKGRWRLPCRRLAPELEAAIQPVNFRFNGHQAAYVRPVYIATRWTLWQGAVRSLSAKTEQEIGHNPFVNVVLLFALYARTEPTRRVEIFVSGSPGGEVHVSPEIGAFRDGIAIGFRLSLRS
jgi:hypothetical protein